MMKIHPEGLKTVTIVTALLMIGISLNALLLPLPWFLVSILPLLIIFILTIRFFRIPKRAFILNPEYILSPADGTIAAIENVYENEYFNSERKVVSIFMSIHNVHINFFPVKGKVQYFKYHPGKYLLARNPKSSQLNERSTVVVKSERNEIMIRQIAGFVARRIICYANPGREVEQNEQMGIIKFGSRVDIFLPPDSTILVKLGEKVTAGVSRIA